MGKRAREMMGEGDDNAEKPIVKKLSSSSNPTDDSSGDANNVPGRDNFLWYR